MEHIYRTFWVGFAMLVSLRTIDSHMASIRKKLEVDPETGITFPKVKTFGGKNDIINNTGGFNLSPDARFVVLEKKVVPLNENDPFDLVDMKALRAIYAPGMKSSVFCRQRHLDHTCFF